MLPLSMSETYNSVQHDIVEKAQNPKYGISNLTAIMTVSEKINEVFSHHNNNMSQQEKRWLGEKLAWETLFPKEKASFPGKRPKNPTAKMPVTPTSQICSTCEREGITPGSENCPYVRVGTCHRRGHGEYTFRLGSSEFLDPKCPTCYWLKQEATSEGWEML